MLFAGHILLDSMIRQYLSKVVAISLVNALVSSRLDYCNSLYRASSKGNLRSLQCQQNELGTKSYFLKY